MTQRSHTLFFLLSCLVAGAAFFNTAWVSDDAYITFRAVRNFLEGYGPVWNLGERVQVFTHPLWFLTLSGVTFFTQDPYWGSLLLSALCLAGTLFLIARLADTRLHASLAILALALSKVFIDYTSSGLENPLSYLVLSSLFYGYCKLQEKATVSALSITLLSGVLLSLNRFDLALIATPVAAAALYQCKHLGILRLAGITLISTMPMTAWLLFATFYYGSPLPNTYFAKLSTLIPATDLFAQGIEYTLAFIRFDVSSFILICVGIAVGARGILLPFALGIAFYSLYIIKVGGDFMLGRFYGIALLTSLLILLKATPLALHRTKVFALAIAAGVPSIFVTVLSPAQYSDAYISTTGIANERGFYNYHTGLRRNLRTPMREEHVFAALAREINRTHAALVESCNVGMLGYYSNHNVFIIDGYGLTDPLLARLPSLSPWRIGHFERDTPAGYHAAILGISPQLQDPSLNALWQDLKLAHRAPLVTSGRMDAIFRLHTHAWKQNIQASTEVKTSLQKGKPSMTHCRNVAKPSFQIIATFDQE